MLDKLLGRGAKKKRRPASDDPFASIELDDSIDLESGTIYIDDTIEEDKVVATTDVLKANTEVDPRSKLSVTGGKVFLIDLNPFFKSIGTKKGERAAQNFIRFCENWLSRQVGGTGAFEIVRNEIIFFRLGLPNREAAAKAMEIVNSIGQQYLRDAFKPTLMPDLLGALDEADATRDGMIDADKAMIALEQWRKLDYEARRNLMANGWVTAEKPPDGGAYLVPIRAERKVSERVVRGPERRKKRTEPYDGPERRRRKYGRRASDDPRNGAAWK